MSGGGRKAAAGAGSAIDHDRLFKDLLTAFFFEFLELFFPRLAAAMDPESVEFQPQEVFSELVAGEGGQRLVVDILAKAAFRDDSGGSAFFMVHVEHQSTATSDFLERFFRYHIALWNKYGVKVYPIVVYSHDKPRRRQPSVLRTMFPDGEVLRFTCRVVQLNRLPWRRFVKSDNPLASALMAKMKMAARDRARVKLECLRLLVTGKADPARMRLIGVFVDTYLRLNAAEQKRFARSIEQAPLTRRVKEQLVEYTTSWEQQGIAKGLVQGRVEGRQQGRQEGRVQGAVETLRAVLLDVIGTRFDADASAAVADRVNQIDSVDELRALTHRALTAASPAELGLLPEQQQQQQQRRRPARRRGSPPIR